LWYGWQVGQVRLKGAWATLPPMHPTTIKTMTTTRSRFTPAFIAKSGVLAAAVALTVQAGESKALDLPFPIAPQECFAAAINAGTCTASIGDKIFKNISLTGFTARAGDRILFQVLNAPLGTAYALDYSFAPGLQGNAPDTSGVLNYEVDVEPSFVAAGFGISAVQANITGGNLSGGSFSTSLTSTGLLLPTTLVAGSSPNINPSVVGSYNPIITNPKFTQAFSVTGGQTDTITKFGIQLIQQSPPAPVPSPLPILGAGAAFGFSRKLRRRIRTVA